LKVNPIGIPEEVTSSTPEACIVVPPIFEYVPVVAVKLYPPLLAAAVPVTETELDVAELPPYAQVTTSL
jgi:hypothetical protein